MPTMALSSASAAAAAAKAKAANIMLPNSSPYSITCGFKQSQNRSSTAPLPLPIGRPLRFGDFFSASQISLVHKCTTTTAAPTTNSSHLSTITAQSSVDYIPEASFYKVEAVLRPWRVPQVSSAMLKMGIRGVTVSDVRGFGAQGGLTERQAGSEFSEDKFVAKVKMEIVVSKNQVEAVIEKIIEEARTGEIGDGKIFVVPVADVIRVRTGERGEKAERMMGGLTDMFSAAESSAA